MSQIIEGQLYRSGNAQSRIAQLAITAHHINIIVEGVEQGSHAQSSVQYSDAIPGIATEIRFENGDLFIPLDKNWRQAKQRGSFASLLESNRASVFAAIVLAPLLVYWLIMVAMPKLASKSVEWLPDNIAVYMGEQSFTILEETFLSPSKLDDETNEQINALFASTLDTLNLDTQKYQIYFRESDYFGANALALPDGTVIVTDGLVKQLEKYAQTHPNTAFDSMLTAIILHEIGHVEDKHSLRLVAQSLTNAIVFALLLGDLETVGELMVGASSAVIQASFSRDMETEADEFALRNMDKLGFKASAFADAMASFEDDNAESTQNIIHYLSSHPAIKERIERAKRFKQIN